MDEQSNVLSNLCRYVGILLELISQDFEQIGDTTSFDQMLE